MVWDCIIMGGGAAGLYCARTAGWRGRRVLVLEHNRNVGAKILISGGGRCNFTNINTAPEHFLSSNPAFCRSALARHPPSAFVELVKRYDIAFYEKTLGQLFCEGAGAAHKIVRLLLDNAPDVEVRTGCRVNAVSRTEDFRVETDQGVFTAKALVVATGGLSIPKIGASDFAYRIARQFGVPVAPARPGLVPLTFATEELRWMRALSGVSANAVVTAGAASFREAVLFTHRGLSGPAILQASSYWQAGIPLMIDWLADFDAEFLVARKHDKPRLQIKSALAEIMPARLAEMFSGGFAHGALADLKDSVLRAAGEKLKNLPVLPTGTEGYAKAEVTVGGVDVNALSQQTMAVHAVPNLYFIGEALDVAGWLGGYNFQWAWASAHAAAEAI